MNPSVAVVLKSWTTVVVAVVMCCCCCCCCLNTGVVNAWISPTTTTATTTRRRGAQWTAAAMRKEPTWNSPPPEPRPSATVATAPMKVRCSAGKPPESGSGSRRQWLAHSAARWVTTVVATTVVVVGGRPAPAEATYSAYQHREEDWQRRRDSGDVQFGTARSLRQQLREIAPMNTEGSQIFCPNGPSAAVSPLMENKCSDTRMALPSVYGRTQDVVGNSIPGFATGTSSSSGSSSSASWSPAADMGGMPDYGFSVGRK